jgi:hypothetical protein
MSRDAAGSPPPTAEYDDGIADHDRTAANGATE